MKIRQIRNATILLDYGQTKILIDPMLARKGEIPSLKWITKSRRRNPLVGLPEGTSQVLDSVTHVLITHCQKGHFDHLDRAGRHWIRKNKLPVLCSDHDRLFLEKAKLRTISLAAENTTLFLDGSITSIQCLHGEGFVGSLMAHGCGYILKFSDQPVVYVIGDSIRTDVIEKTIRDYQPDVVIMPGGGARFDIGGDIIMSLEDIAPIADLFNGKLIVNHLEALDHCPVTRSEVRSLVCDLKLQDRVYAPEDGEEIII